MPDKLSQVGKNLGQTRKNAETAIRRYQPIHNKIERIRDIFDEETSFEMEFESEVHDSRFQLDLYFNKPPPLSANCSDGARFNAKCTGFTFTINDGESHLVNVGQSYWPLTVVVYLNGIKLTQSQYSEYSPADGLVYIVSGLDYPQEITVCFVATDWTFQCPEGDPFAGTTKNVAEMHTFYGFGNSQHDVSIGARMPGSPDSVLQVGTNYATRPTADYYLWVAEKASYLQWSTHLDDLANLPLGVAGIDVDGSTIFDENGSTINWTGDFRLTMTVTLVSGTYFDEELEFFTFSPEAAIATIDIDNLRINLHAKYQDRGFGQGAHAGLGGPPRIEMSVVNAGRVDKFGNFNPFGDSTELGGTPLPYNEPINIIIEHYRTTGRIFVTVGGQSFDFSENPYWDNISGPFSSMAVYFVASSFIVQPSIFYLHTLITSMTNCDWHPSGNNI